MRILVADDDPEMLSVVVDVLRGHGHVVEKAPDGGRLLVELARPRRVEEVIDLVVSDLRMPTCNGLQILEALRNARRSIPFVLMTAFADDTTRARVERLSAAVLLEKPFQIHTLSAAVGDLLAPRC